MAGVGEIKEAIKYYRRLRKLTQKELAAKIEVSRSSVAMWESGANVPKTEYLERIAQVLDCPVDELKRGR